jgi:hypothetical protein
MALLVISTQVYENYGAHSWDGKGACPQYWKAKGGHEYKVLNIDVNRAEEIFRSVESKCTEDNDYFRESVIDWSVEGDDYLSWFEKSQLEYEGRITFPEPILEAA